MIEVLFPSTEQYDRGRKFLNYRRIESLREYVLVAQNQMAIEQFVRDGDRWILSEFRDPEQLLRLRSIGCEVRLSEI